MIRNGLIVRADDFGSSRAADEAILTAVGKGCLVRNVSCMAGGGSIAADAARLCALRGKADLGLHFTVNSEWDALKWSPCAPRGTIPSLLDAKGDFYPSAQTLAAARPSLEELTRELEAQWRRLAELGLPISYVDTHMAPDAFIPGLSDRMRRWAREKGILYAPDYDAFPSAGLPDYDASEARYQKNIEEWLDSFTEGEQYLYYLHPARLSDETMLFANADCPPGAVAWCRELERRSAASPLWAQRLRERGIAALRYREAAAPQRHVTEIGTTF